MKHTKHLLIVCLIMSAVRVCIPAAGAVATSVSAGGGQTLALMSDGTIWEWGSNRFGQLGNGTTVDGLYPRQLVGVSGITSISAGVAQTAVLDSSGNVWDWGWLFDTLDEIGPAVCDTPVWRHWQRNSDFVGVLVYACPGYRRERVGMGKQSYGQIGGATLYGGSGDDSPTPVPVAGLANIISVSAGYYNACALDTAGNVWTWGVITSVRLTGIGDGPSYWTTTPQQVTGLPPASAVSVGMYHTVALDTAGNVWTWGLNTHGQLGQNGTSTNYTPELVLSGVKAISRRLSYARAGDRWHHLGVGR